jgi:hypothetical protein
VAATLRALKGMDLYIAGHTFAAIAKALGYADHSGPAHAIQRLRDRQAEWARWEADTGRRPYHRHQPTRRQLERAARALEEEWRTGGLDGARLAHATDELRRIIAGTRPRWQEARDAQRQ